MNVEQTITQSQEQASQVEAKIIERQKQIDLLNDQQKTDKKILKIVQEGIERMKKQIDAHSPA